MIWNKITVGFVIQTYEDDKCIEQEFFAGDGVDAEDMGGQQIKLPCNEQYQPFDMVQPNPPDATI